MLPLKVEKEQKMPINGAGYGCGVGSGDGAESAARAATPGLLSHT
jgi:hypothetical protein